MNYTSLRNFKRDLPPKWKKQLTLEYNLEFPPIIKESIFFNKEIKLTRKITKEERVWLYKLIKKLLPEVSTDQQDEKLCNIINKLEDDLGFNWEGLNHT